MTTSRALVAGRPVPLEDYAAGMITKEEMHQEVDKMLRKPGAAGTFSELQNEAVCRSGRRDNCGLAAAPL
jgi:hypothetical protein